MPSDQNNTRFESRQINDTLNRLQESKTSHTILIYPNLRTLRKVYSKYLNIKIQKNRIVVILPYYETVESVKKNIRMVTNSKQNDFAESNDGVKSENSRLVFDSYDIMNNPSIKPMNVSSSIFSGHDMPIINFLCRTLAHADSLNKESVEFWIDMGPFFNSKLNIKYLLQYEKISSRIFKDTILRQYCLFHKKDFEIRLKDKQQNNILDCHLKKIFMMDRPQP